MQVGDEALQLALEEQREQCATLEARLATTQVRRLFSHLHCRGREDTQGTLLTSEADLFMAAVATGR